MRALTQKLQTHVQRFAASSVLVAFDFDGVLAPIIGDRRRARLAPQVRRALIAVARRYPCIVVSGRPLADLEPRLSGIPLRAVYGNFGFEPAWPGQRPPARVRAWAEQLRLRLAVEGGVYVEDKGYSLAVHYRQAPDRAAARQAIDAAIRSLSGVRVLEGTLAVSLLPARGMHKGTALQRARRELGCRLAIYAGDDGTDEDAFASAPPSRLVAIRVGGRGPSSAPFRLRHQAHVLTLLQLLISQRHPG